MYAILRIFKNIMKRGYLGIFSLLFTWLRGMKINISPVVEDTDKIW
jgi:hypothetical protein